MRSQIELSEPIAKIFITDQLTVRDAAVPDFQR